MIRKAAVQDKHIMSQIALLSKAHWGYTKAFMDACKPELTIKAAEFKHKEFYIYLHQGQPVAFYGLNVNAKSLDYLFVHPEHIGKGIGRALWAHMIDTAKQHGLKSFTIDSDPYAEPFYIKMGAEKIGETPSGSISGRFLPLLRYILS